MTAADANIFRKEHVDPSGEIMQTLLKTGAFRLERIVSNGACTPAGEWYDQREDEWVVVLTGRARLRFESPEAELELLPGDHVNIPAHRRHRVEWTAPNEPTVWLALHYLP